MAITFEIPVIIIGQGMAVIAMDVRGVIDIQRSGVVADKCFSENVTVLYDTG